MQKINKYKDIDLKDLLENLGEVVIPHGRKSYKLEKHDSLIITGNMFFWNSKQVGGGAIKLLENLYNLSKENAIFCIDTYLKLNQKKEVKKDVKKLENKQNKEYIYEFKDDFEKVKEYLVDKRKLDENIIKNFYDNDLIKIDEKNNILLKITDIKGNLAGYDIIGTTKKRFRTNTSKNHSGMNITNNFNNEVIENLYVFEAPIDLMSYLIMEKEKEHKFSPSRFLSLSGVREDIMEQYLTKDINKIVICTDNDEAGENFYEEIKEKYSKKYQIVREKSIKKDWNEDLVEMRKKENKRSFRIIDDDELEK